ncbi:alkylation response protein AidB-like acyl-CoA dehydrogenase [Bacillus benzoevorans]|uniref:Alkylation response protein AidB-like acyl-CoA dehydrogenase n=1 Tax=Bacillus benzoevorans TaxID=1456 RepID=A0A7X0HNG9_9BACI|nr:alkylation response protein AidB-like acyl-CoA dehydrogenase [Bacillus benzoevorans]
MKQLFIKTERQREWIDKLEKHQASFSSYSQEIDEKSRFPVENIQALIHMGYTTLPLSKEFGGEGISISDMVLFQETISSFDGATGLSIGWHQSVVGELYEKKLWDKRVLERFAQQVKSGALVNRAASEAQTGSPTRGGRPGTTAEKKAGKWIISGRKIFTTMSPALTHFLVTAWIAEKGGIGVFLIEKDSNGLSLEENWHVISMRGTESHDLVLNQVEVAEENFVEFFQGTKGKSLNAWLLHIPACYLGIAQAARDYSVQFAADYSPNSITGTISQLPNVQSLIGKMDLELMKARHFLYSVAELYDDHSRRPYITNELGAAKHIVTNSSLKIVDQAMRIVGAKSLQLSNPLQRYYRDARAGLHNPPMDDMTIAKIAQTAISEMKK